ncbi:MAG: hypothetical protein SGPRY_006418, partial [Prymnesium sp.]
MQGGGYVKVISKCLLREKFQAERHAVSARAAAEKVELKARREMEEVAEKLWKS